MGFRRRIDRESAVAHMAGSNLSRVRAEENSRASSKSLAAAFATSSPPKPAIGSSPPHLRQTVKWAARLA